MSSSIICTEYYIHAEGRSHFFCLPCIVLPCPILFQAGDSKTHNLSLSCRKINNLPNILIYTARRSNGNNLGEEFHGVRVEVLNVRNFFVIIGKALFNRD